MKRILHPVPEAQELLGGISRGRFYQLVADGYLVLTKIGRRSFVTDENLNNCVRALSSKQPEKAA